MTRSYTPTVRLAMLGSYLRQFREDAGLSPGDAARLLNPTKPQPSIISRMENGKHGVTHAEARILGEEYHRRAPDRVDADVLLNLAGSKSQRGRWIGHRQAVPLRHRPYYDWEQDATSVLVFLGESVPGLLMTEEYARAQMANSPRLSARQIDDIVKARMERQRQVLDPEDRDPGDVHFVLSESCLWRVHGDDGVMRRQMMWLDELSRRTNIHIQVLGRRAAATGVRFDFTLIRVPRLREVDPPMEVVYREDPYADGDYSDDAPTVEEYRRHWGHLVSSSADRKESRRLIKQYADEYS